MKHIVLYCFVIVLSGLVCMTNGAGGTFWQITDIHWDRAYNRSGNSSSWCHVIPLQLSVNSSSASSAAAGVDNGYYGNYSCDPPWVLVKSAIAHMAKLQSHPDFILWTGDNAPHWSTGPDFKYIYSAIADVTKQLIDAFPAVPILPCIGNHDSFPANQFPGDNSTSFYRRYLTEGSWDRVLSAEAQNTFATAGYYTWSSPKDLMVVVLNTNIYYRTNDRISPDQRDPGGQLVWLERQLKSARAAHKQVIMAGHIAPGYFERWPDQPYMFTPYNEALLRIISAYHDVILTQVYGHSHTDSFRVIAERSDDGKLSIRSSALIAPSVTPWVPQAGTNPGVRLYQYSSTVPPVLLDYSQYVLNLTTSNLAPHAARWQLLYSARDAYDLPDLSAVSLALLYHRLLNDSSLFDAYYAFNTGGHVTADDAVCSLSCKRRQLCAIVHMTEQSMSACLNTAMSTDALMSGRMLDHGAGLDKSGFPVLQRGEGDSRTAIITAALIASALVVLVGLIAFAFIYRKRVPRVLMRRTPTASSAQGYETMT